MDFEVPKTKSEKPALAPVELPQSEQSTEVLEVPEESKTDLSNAERLEAREFSKEHSRAARSRLAKQIINKRWWYRVRIPDITAEQDAVVAVEQEKVATQQAGRLQTLETLEIDLEKLKTEREQWVALETELTEVGTQLEKVKAGFWAYFLNRFTKKIDQLEVKRIELYQQEESTPRVSEWAVPIAERDLEQKKLLHEQSAHYEDGVIARMLEKNKDTLQSLIKDDNWVETSKKQIRELYEKNLELKHEYDAEDPEERDVAASCRKHNVILMHGFPIGTESAQTDMNQPSFETYSFLGEERALVMAALEPAVATSSKSLDSSVSEQFTRREMYYNTGFILAGGEVMSAYANDAGTYAHDLDSRFPKYDSALVSDLQRDITENFAQAQDAEVRNERSMGGHNEISVKHPKIAALYIHDQHDHFGKSDTQLTKEGFLHPYGVSTEVTIPTSQNVLKKMLTLAERMGLPLILTKKSGEMVNLLEGSRPVTLDELLDQPITYSPEERMAFLEEANVGEKMREATGDKTKKQIDAKLAKFSEEFGGTDPVMEERKQRNKALAAAQLRLMNA